MNLGNEHQSFLIIIALLVANKEGWTINFLDINNERFENLQRNYEQHF